MICDFSQTNNKGWMSSRRRPREPTRQVRPLTRSITRQTEERARQKPRLSDICPDHKVDSTLTQHRDVKQEVLSPHEYRDLPLPTIASGMAFSYPHFNGEIDAASHIRLFLNVWNANHMARRLLEEEAHQSKMTEFGLTLDGRAAFWHSQMDLPAINTFD